MNFRIVTLALPATFAALLTATLLLLVFTQHPHDSLLSSAGTTSSPSCSGGGNAAIIGVLNAVLARQVPRANAWIEANAPASIGRCSSASAPTPCKCIDNECSNLFYRHKLWEYKVIARWVAGVNTARVHKAEVVSLGIGQMRVRVNGSFTELPLRLYLAECFTMDRCSKVWDNANACCGRNKAFELEFDVFCQPEEPFLRRIALASFDISDLRVDESMLGVHIRIADITDAVKAAVRHEIAVTLANEHLIRDPYAAGKPLVSLVRYLNDMMQHQLPGVRFPCLQRHTSVDAVPDRRQQIRAANVVALA